MDIPYRKLKIDDVQRATDMAQERRQHTALRALKYLQDPDKIKRRAAQECVCCFYGDRIGGAAITRSFCGHCEQELMHGSTNIDKLCKDCGVRLGLCVHCTATIELKLPRKIQGLTA